MTGRGPMTWLRRKLLLALGIIPVIATGCNPLGAGLLTPIPMQPWVAEHIEDKYLHKNDHRAVIMPPIKEGAPLPLCEDMPTEREVLRAIRRPARGVPFIYEEFRDNIRFNFERLVDRIDPPRPFPLIGWAQVHHCHWRVTIYWDETIQSDYPVPYQFKKRRTEVVYIDKDHLHLYVGPDAQIQREITRDLTDFAP